MIAAFLMHKMPNRLISMAKLSLKIKGIVIPVVGHSEIECSCYQNLPNEKWAQSSLLGEFYEVSILGRVRSLTHVSEWFNGHCVCQKTIKGIILRGTISKDGYINVTVSRKRYFIHRLVASAFIEGDKTMEVNHKNGIKFDNRIENLEYLSHIDNMRHAVNSGLIKNGLYNNFKGNVKKKRFNDAQVAEIRSLYHSKRYKQKELALMYNTHKDTIGQICRGIRAYSQNKR